MVVEWLRAWVDRATGQTALAVARSYVGRWVYIRLHHQPVEIVGRLVRVTPSLEIETVDGRTLHYFVAPTALQSICALPGQEALQLAWATNQTAMTDAAGVGLH